MNSTAEESHLVVAKALDEAAKRAKAYLASLDTRRIGASAGVEELRAALQRPLPVEGCNSCRVIAELADAVEPGLNASSGARFFAWVIGGSTPASLAADWLTSAWDQNAGMFAVSPAAAIVEEVCGVWLKDVLGLPATASFALVTGCQMAHTTCLAAARDALLRRRGWDVEVNGLAGAPAVRILTSSEVHSSILRSARLLGFGSRAVETLPADDHGRLPPRSWARLSPHRTARQSWCCRRAI